jgi:hypothetical protein
MNKIYVDTHFKTKDSASNTDFKMYLNQALEIKEDMKMFVCDICLPNTWYSIESTNENLYVETTDELGAVRHFIVKLDRQNYSVVELAAQIQTKLNAALNKPFLVNYVASTGRLTVSTSQTNFTFSILTDDQLVSFNGWKGNYYDKKNPKSCNDVLNNVVAKVCNVSNPFLSGFVSTINYNSIYLRSNVNSLDNIGPDGNSSDIIKKIPTTAAYGALMTNYDLNVNDYTHIKNRNAITMLEFRLTDAYGNVVDLHGSHVSFTLIFQES